MPRELVSKMAVAPSTDGVLANDAYGSPLRMTVVIPHYNHIDFLPRAIASVLDQNVDNLEILVVDDGSSPDCQSVLDRLAELQPAIRLIRHPINRGAPAALNTGLAAARGEMVSFLGADDLALPGLYDTMRVALEDYPDAAFACGEIAIVGDDGSVLGVRPLMAPALAGGYLSPEYLARRIRTTDNWICNTATVYRTSLLRHSQGFDEGLGAFCDGFLVRVLAFQSGFVFVPGLYGVWRIAADTLSANSMLQPDVSVKLVDRILARLSISSVALTAPHYPAIYSRRLRFGAARLHFVWNKLGARPEDVCKTARLGVGDLRVLTALKRTIGFGVVGRAFALAWLVARLRPFGPVQLSIHMVRNHLMWLRNTKRVRASVLRAETLGQRLMGGVDAAQ